jgi:uncharacterized membrane protein
MAVVSTLLMLYATFGLAGRGAPWIISGGAIYLIGVVLVTGIRNVPMNKQLDAMDHSTPETASYWPTYVAAWTRWNHARSAASAGSTVCFFIGCILLAQS